MNLLLSGGGGGGPKLWLTTDADTVNGGFDVDLVAEV